MQNPQGWNALKKTKKSKAGRPPRHRGQRLSQTRSFRVRGELDERLSGAAKASGRSISEEIESRLDRSFYMDGVLWTVANQSTPLVYGLATAVSLAMNSPDIEEKDKPRALQVACVFLVAALTGTRPKKSERIRNLAWLVSTRYAGWGITIAELVLKNLGLTEALKQLDEDVELFKAETAKHKDLSLAEFREKMKGEDEADDELDWSGPGTPKMKEKPETTEPPEEN